MSNVTNEWIYTLKNIKKQTNKKHVPEIELSKVNGFIL